MVLWYYKSRKKTAYFKVLCELPAAREQLKLENMNDSERGIHLGQNLCINQQFSALNVYKKIVFMSGATLEKILEWDGWLDEFSMDLSTQFPLFSGNNLDSIEKELLWSTKSHYDLKKHRYVMKLLDQSLRGDISGIQDVQFYSPEYNITF